MYFEFPGAKTYLGKTATMAVFKPSQDGESIAFIVSAEKNTKSAHEEPTQLPSGFEKAGHPVQPF